MKYLVPVGRLLFSYIFIMGGIHHFSSGMVAYAESSGVPMAHIAVPLAGILAVAGGLSVLLGYKTRYGALLLIVFLIPVTLMMHAFWKVTDPNMAGLQQIMFMKNLAMIGGAIFLFHFGAGPVSLDAKCAAKPTQN